jgi:5'(3')-deoxyribonucleotidase
MINRNIESQTPYLIEDSFVLCSKWNVVKLDCAIIIANANSRLDAGLVGPRQS